MTATCCPNCLWLKDVSASDFGRHVNCPVCKTEFDIYDYKPTDFILPDSAFEYPVPKSPLKLAFDFLSWCWSGMQKKPKPEQRYIDRMIELTRDDGIFSPDDAKDLDEYAFQLGLPDSEKKRLQYSGLCSLIQIFCRDGVLDDDERRSLESVVSNGLVTAEDLNSFASTLQKPLLKGMLRAGRLPVMPTDLLESPRKNEILHWAGKFTPAKQTKTILRYESSVDMMITNLRIVLQYDDIAPKSIAWDKLKNAYYHSVKVADGSTHVLLALLKYTAKKPLLLANGDKETAVQIIKGIRSGSLKMEGIQEVSKFL